MQVAAWIALIVILFLFLVVLPGLTVGRDITGSALGGLGMGLGILVFAACFTAVVYGLLTVAVG